ncbi:hypothetical protein JXA88_17350 [Candidatus Fermentibacteria bacterium]|nr:hypothetical protein [Candidatus Fermentibacteria bacterium]
MKRPFMAVGLAIAVISCGHGARFRPGPWVSPRPDSLATADTLLASGRVLATEGTIRFRARWAAAACKENLRVQVFGTDGSFIADISFSADSLSAFLPGLMECHQGAIVDVPLDSLLGITVPWKTGLTVLWATLWPGRITAPWVSGSLGHRQGWYAPSHGAFVQIHPRWRLPQYLSFTDGSSCLSMEVRSWKSTTAGMLPSALRFSWPARDVEMWIDLSIRETEAIESAALQSICPPGAHAHAW